VLHYFLLSYVLHYIGISSFCFSSIIVSHLGGAVVAFWPGHSKDKAKGKRQTTDA